MSKNEIVKVEHLNKEYVTDGKAFQVLKDINLTINEGEFVTIVGHSECGKSTLLKIICGLVDYSDGVVERDGERLADEDIKFRLLVVKPSENGKETYLGKPADVTEEFLVHIYHGTVLYYEGKTDEALPFVKAPDRAFLSIVGKQYKRSKGIFDTNIPEALEKLDNAVVDLAAHGNFPLIEPLR